MLAYQTVDPHTLELIKQLMTVSCFKDMRLVGGTALALQYGHRSSVDIDLFGTIDCNNEIIKSELSSIGSLKVISQSENIKCYYLDNIKVDIVNYKYEWIDKIIIEKHLRLASPKDIAAMKINAIEGRGSKKDFIDIYFLLKHYSIKQILSFYKLKYPEFSTFRALMSLTYFEDADQQPSPKMYNNVSWDIIKKYIIQQVKTYSTE